jgi:transporter family protein
MSQIIRADIALALLAFLCLGLTDFIRKRGTLAGASPTTYLLVETAVLLAILPLTAFIIERGIPSLNSGTLVYAPISGVTISIALIALMYGLSLGEGSVVIPLARLGLALATVLSLLLLHEQITWTKVLGLAFAVVAVFLLSR